MSERLSAIMVSCVQVSQLEFLEAPGHNVIIFISYNIVFFQQHVRYIYPFAHDHQCRLQSPLLPYQLLLPWVG